MAEGGEMETQSGFEFDKWCTESGLTKKTVNALQKEELTEKELLVSLSEGEVSTLCSTLGQRKALLTAVTSLQHGQAASSGSSDPLTAIEGEGNFPKTITDLRNQSSLGETGKTFSDLLFGHGPQLTPPPPPPSTPGQFTCYDPRLTLTIKAHKKKATHVTQFLPEKVKRRRQLKKKNFVLSTQSQGEEQLVIKTEDEHPYSGLLISEWVSANCRVMNYLLQSGELARQDVEYYLAHTVNVMDYADSYEWESVLDFDYHYRELQAEHSFPWGTYPPYMEARMTPRRAPAPRPFPHPPSVPDCKMFKARGTCTFGAQCKFRHVRTPHPAQGTPPPPPPQCPPPPKNESRPPRH
jgi:hypothetical protein